MSKEQVRKEANIQAESLVFTKMKGGERHKLSRKDYRAVVELSYLLARTNAIKDCRKAVRGGHSIPEMVSGWSELAEPSRSLGEFLSEETRSVFRDNPDSRKVRRTVLREALRKACLLAYSTTGQELLEVLDGTEGDEAIGEADKLLERAWAEMRKNRYGALNFTPMTVDQMYQINDGRLEDSSVERFEIRRKGVLGGESNATQP